jgi:hypothetical protein
MNVLIKVRGFVGPHLQKGVDQQGYQIKKKQCLRVKIPLVNLSRFFLNFLLYILGKVETISAVLKSLC